MVDGAGGVERSDANPRAAECGEFQSLGRFESLMMMMMMMGPFFVVGKFGKGFVLENGVGEMQGRVSFFLKKNGGFKFMSTCHGRFGNLQV